jgi:hypothetical protein
MYTDTDVEALKTAFKLLPGQVRLNRVLTDSGHAQLRNRFSKLHNRINSPPGGDPDDYDM